MVSHISLHYEKIEDVEMKEFLGFGGYTRTPEGFFSWQHLVFVGSLLVIMVLLAIYFGKKNACGTDKQKNRVLIASALLIDGFEIFKIVVLCLRSKSYEAILLNLPLFLCSIQLLALPIAAFSKGRIKEAATDFVCLFGILGAVFGTIGAGQNYNAYPVLSMDNVVSGITHSISGFASLYVMIAKVATLKKKNIWVTCSILCAFCVAAYIANITIPYNYMFLMAGDGTPYDIFYNLVGGNRIAYPLIVVGLFVAYIALFYSVAIAIARKKRVKSSV